MRPHLAKTLKRLSKEMTLPALVAAGWAAYSYYADPKKRTLVDMVNTFGPAFFLAAWAVGQFFRVEKQNKTEAHLEGLQASLQETASMLKVNAEALDARLSELKDGTDDLVGYATGGDSYVEVSFHKGNVEAGELLVTAHGKFPLHNVNMHIIDSVAHFKNVRMAAALTLPEPKAKAEYRRIGDIAAGKRYILHRGVEPLAVDRRLLDFEVLSINGTTNQTLRVAKVGSAWLTSSVITKEGRVILSKMDDGFPDDEDWSLDEMLRVSLRAQPKK